MAEKIRPRMVRIDVANLFLDAKNPRLPESVHSWGEQDNISTQIRAKSWKIGSPTTLIGVKK